MPISPTSDRVRFGPFEADLRSGELCKEGVRIKLHQQPFQVLALLLEHLGEVVTREELQRKLWPSDTFVDFDVGLNSAVKKLREALHDSAEKPRYIETLPRRGYRFVAPLGKLEAPGAHSTVPELPSPERPSVLAGELRKPASWTRSRRTVWLGVSGGLAVATLLIALNGAKLKQRLWAGGKPVSIHSIAVLPLENLSGDPGQEYFSDGITDALITDLAQISSLKVISRTSTMRYKGARPRLPQIAKELGADAILEGAVVRSGERVRIDAQLVEGSTDRHFWARSYERNLGDVIALQNEVARAVAGEIQAKLTPAEQARLLRAVAINPQAYELYLWGLRLWDRQTEETILKSIDYFKQAIQKQPDYAAAYVALAEAYVWRTDVPRKEACSQAKDTARMALQIDDLGEVHSAIAMCLFTYDWDWTGAEREFQRALALNPNHAMTHQWYAQFLSAMGKRELATAEVNRAHELDPLSLLIGGGGIQFGQRFDEMIAYNRRRLELDPTYPRAYTTIGEAYAHKGMYQEAIPYLEKGVSLSGGAPDPLSELGYTFAVSGKRDEAIKVLQQLEQPSKHRYVPPFDIAMVYAGLGEKDLAFNWLQRAVSTHHVGLAFLTDSGGIASLHSDPRYAELRRQVGLP